jgi:MFS family permease
MTDTLSGASRGAFAVFSNAAFRWFTIAGTLWMMADNIEHVISYWVLFDKFDSPLLGGYAVISHWAPFLLGGVYFGALADKYDGRKLFLIAMAMFMTVSLGWAYVIWTDSLAVWHAVVLLTLHGLAGVIYTPASQVMIHDIVGNDQLTSGVRLTATTRSLGLMLGPAIGGGLLIVTGPAAGLAINAAIYIPMVVWSLREPYTGHSHEDPLVVAARKLSFGLGTTFQTIREASANRTIASMLILAGLTSFLVGNAHQAQMPEFAKEFLSTDGGVLYSALLIAGAIGAIAGGLILEMLPSMSPTPRKATIFAIAWSASLLVFAVAPNYWVALFTLFISGALLIAFNSMAQSLVQLEAPVDQRGRIIGLYNMALNGLRIGSGVTVGFLGAVIGIHWSLGLSTAALMMACVPILMYVRRHAREPRVMVEVGVSPDPAESL